MQLRPYQTNAINKIAELFSRGIMNIIFQLATGGGKCLAKDTPVLMYDGTIKMVQDIKTGDLLMGPDSNCRRVLSTCTGSEMMYRIVPKKGDPYTVNESHILSLRVTGLNNRSILYNGCHYRTGDIVNISVRDYLLQNKTFKHCLKGWRTSIEFNNQATLKIPPYILGLWLGDGTSKGVSFATKDQEIVEQIYQYAQEMGCRVRAEHIEGKCPMYHITQCINNGRGGGGNFALTKFQEYGLIKNKHVPSDFKTASRTKRLELLAGIIDSDGHAHHNGYDIVFKSETLSRDVAFVARSLGLLVTVAPCKKKCCNNGVVGNYFKIHISGDCSVIPVKLNRRKVETRSQIKNVLNTGISVEQIGIGNYFGFEIDGDRLFVLGDFTVTHNTVTFSGLVQRFRQASPKKIVIVVHRDELLNQARKTLYKWYGFVAEPVVAGVKFCNPNADVYVTMVETANNRLKRNPNFFGDVGLVIIDEAHLGNFKKLHKYFENALTVGFTATPLSSSKKHPLNEDFQDIVCGIDIPELIQLGSLVPNRTFVVKGSVKRENLKIKNGEFDSAQMGAEFSKSRYIQACVEGYIKHGNNGKALVFNCNIEHSRKVNEAFIEAGYPSRHLDGEMPEEERAEILEWFANTPGAILNNIGILTAGFDAPSVETVIMNRSTKSLPLWLQCTGRGSRPFPGKAFFTIIDLGGNATEHGDWCMPRDWDYIFKNPGKPSKEAGVAPVKECVDCEALIHANARVCMYCGSEQPVKEISYNQEVVEFELLESSINVATILQSSTENGFNSYAALHQIKYMIVEQARQQSANMDASRAYGLLTVFQHKVADWCKENGKNYDQWHKETTAQWFWSEIKKKFGWEPEQLSIAL